VPSSFLPPIYRLDAFFPGAGDPTSPDLPLTPPDPLLFSSEEVLLSFLIGGGIGADLTSVEAVPDPGTTLLLLGMSVTGLVAARRRWR
jgi:hypothetical protein